MILTIDTIHTAMTGKRIGTMDTQSLVVALGQIASDVAALAGFETQIFGEQTDELAADLRRGYPRLTLDEIRLACKAGVSGEFGVGGRPTYASVTRWVREYDGCAMVADARKTVAQTPRETRTVTPDEGLAIMRREMPANLKRRWDDIRTNGIFTTGRIPHVSAQLLDWLRDEGVLTVDNALWRECVRRAKTYTQGGSVWDVSRLEGGEALIRSRAKHIYLQEWMRERHGNGLPPVIPAQVRRVYA